MKTFQDFLSLKDYINQQKELNKTIGFVPTMGALHQGHLSLLKECIKENDISVCSIFVNPTQFNNKNDLKTYPRDDAKDSKLLEINHCDILFLPTVEEVYPEGEKTMKFDFNGLENEMEGAYRPGHFDGVGTILYKLFSMIQPDKAYFGEKDFQQLRIVQTLAENYFNFLAIVPVEIYRESSGLALSSRNAKLTTKQKEEALLIYQTLERVKQIIHQESFKNIQEWVEKAFKASNLKLEYFTIANEKNLKPLEHFEENTPTRAFIAAYAGDVRLIDNMKLI